MAAITDHACWQGMAFSMAFQPIVDRREGSVFAYEALVRGPAGEPAERVLANVGEANWHAFDQACRARAIEMAAILNLAATGAFLSINFLPGSAFEPLASIHCTLDIAKRVGFPAERLIFEISEREQLADPDGLATIVATYRRLGLRVAIDDFGAGYSNLNLLTRFLPDLLKLDISLIRGIDENPVSRLIVRGLVTLCRDLGVVPIAEGIETVGEQDTLSELGITLMQGFLFARPGFEMLPVADQASRDRALALG